MTKKARPSRANGLAYGLAALRRTTRSFAESVESLAAEYARGDRLTVVDLEEHARLISIAAGALTAQFAKRGFELDAYCSECPDVGYSTTDAVPLGWTEVDGGDGGTRMICARCTIRRARVLRRQARAAAARPGLRLVTGSNAPEAETTTARTDGS